MLGVFYCCGSNYFIGNIDNSMSWPLLTIFFNYITW